MRKLILLSLSLISSLPALADKRGTTFEKDGLVYTIASEYVLRRDGFADDTLSIIRNEGEVFVSGVTVSDTVVVIPPVVKFPSSLGRKDTVEASYNVLGIGTKAFEGVRLKNLIIPSGLKFIGAEAFRNMEITDGTFVMPPARIMKANLYDGLKAKVLLLSLKTDRLEPIRMDKTFQITENLPEIYVSHSDYKTSVEGLDKKILYTVGEGICWDWCQKARRNYLDKIDYSQYCSTSISSHLGNVNFKTCVGNITPKIIVRLVRNYKNVGSDIDMLIPYEYECRNTYTKQSERYQEFTMNRTLYRCRKGDVYLYFTLDGKPITNTESLIDDSGQDPFGLQVRSVEEVKTRKAAKARESDLNKKMNDLKKMFGF